VSAPRGFPGPFAGVAPTAPFVPSAVDGARQKSGPAPVPGTNGAAQTGQSGVPRHVAIIMDGNGRWAKKRHLPRLAGHRKGIDAVRAVSRAARDLGIEIVTLYAFSSENWRRPAEEVSDLMGLLKHFINSDLDELHANNVRLRVIGDHQAFAPDLVKLIDGAVARTADNSGSTLVIGLNYGSQDELVRAMRRLVGHDPEHITAATIEAALDTADLPPVDLLIRTSGEHRLSNFMLWQAAYAELLFVDTLWPDFGRAELAAALTVFAARERRFGGL
jgi:undecaprenyl diphosphate synthase